MKSLIILALFFFSDIGLAEFRLLDTEEISIDTWRTTARRDSYQPAYTGQWTSGSQFNFDLRMFQIFRWDNHLHLDSTDAQIRNVGWRFDIFMDFYKPIQPFYHHHSQHSLDSSEHAIDRFPLEDEYGLRFLFYSRDSKAPAL